MRTADEAGVVRRPGLVALVVLLAFTAAACGRSSDTLDTARDLPPVAIAEPVLDAPAADGEAGEVPEPTPTARPISPLAGLTTPLDSALYDPAEHQPALRPVWLSIDGLRIDSAPVTPVGVTEAGEYEVPPADEVGWYRFGPTPGDQGSAVLAAHIAFNGEDGVFRNLDAVEIGAVVEIGYEDGTTAAFEVVSLDQYDKTQLPFDRIFTSEGDPVLTLITCGGDFNRSLNSYEDNIVAYAVPIGT